MQTLLRIYRYFKRKHTLSHPERNIPCVVDHIEHQDDIADIDRHEVHYITGIELCAEGCGGQVQRLIEDQSLQNV